MIMTPIVPKSLATLEYDAIIDRLASHAATVLGRERCERLLPAPSLDATEARLEQTDLFVEHLLTRGDLPFSGIDDIRPFIREAKVGVVLRCGDFLKIASFLRAVDRMREAVDTEDPRIEPSPLSASVRELEPLAGFRQRLEKSIAGDDELFDHASEELYAIRRRLRDAQDDVRRELDRVLARHASALQDPIVTIRGGRYVVPVRSDRRAAVRGLVHDTSATGNTLFIEPMAVVELNNKIRELESREQYEIESILKALTEIVATQEAALLTDVEVLTELDFAMAKARYALEINATRPRMNDRGVMVLRKARHPLIPKDDVVPIDVELGRTFTTLVITGPNTGGKTVTLKTCGLLTWMAMAGLFVPVAEGSELSWFASVEADIGDEQSIEQNLSTFSSHMREIIRITSTAGPGTLVLLDELGAGTDPSEGAALAIAILDDLKQKGCHTIATTHYRELKGYALNEDGVENACCEFDTRTLRPTYKLLIGVPGVSNAFAISHRLGLDPAIIDRARALISDEGARFEDLVSAIEESHREARTIEEEIERLKAETVEARQALEDERETLLAERERVLEQARREASEMLDATRDDVEALLDSIREAQAENKDVDHRLASKARGQLGEIERRHRPTPVTDLGIEVSVLRPEDIRVGERYEARSLGVSGIVREPPDAKGCVTLEWGSFQVQVPVKDLRPVGADDKPTMEPPRKARPNLGSEIVMRAGAELMLLGKRVDEALGMIDQFLDDAVMAGISPVRIVHGKGTGALRKATHEMLTRDRRVETFRLGGDGEGGDGVTVATLRIR